MKMISKETVGGKIVITTKEGRWMFGRRRRQFEAQSKFLPGYWDWLELPDRILVPDALSFQLDAWNKL